MSQTSPRSGAPDAGRSAAPVPERSVPERSVPETEPYGGPGADGPALGRAATTPGEGREAAPRLLRPALALDHLFGSLGLFSVFPVLGLLLAARSPASGTAVVGVGLFCYTTSAGLAAMAMSRLLPRLTYTTGMVGGVLLSAVAFGLLPYAHSPWTLCALLVLAGCGVSVHFTLSRVLIAEVVSDDIGRNRIFSLFQIAVNTAAALGPFVANLLYSSSDPRALMTVVAGCYVVAGVVMLPGIPRDRRPPATTGRWPVSSRTLVRVVRSPEMLRLVVVSTVGTFIYAQFYSAFALHVGGEFDSAALRSALVAGPAVSIVLLQAVVTGVTSRLMNSGTTPFTILGYGTLLFGASMVILGLGLPPVLGAALGVLVFSLAEMMFAPMVSTAFAGLPIGSHLEAFNLRQVCWSSGEALGSLAGGALFLALYREGDGWLYWELLGAVTLACTGLLLSSARRAAVRAAA
ncbi:MFS transporter [Microbispora bryophytorum]|uniref:MFS transporter n=1 Tax=Microbispora bryophytorum TaxID=1460882 RepID=UPI0033D17218